MAYMDYGAYVTRNGEHRADREDCCWENIRWSQYGILGDHTLHVVLGRPCFAPTVWLDGKPVNWAELAGVAYDDGYREEGSPNRFYRSADDGVIHVYGDDWWKDGPYTFTVAGRRVELGVGPHYSRRYGHTSWARLTEPDGTVWEGECGICFGAGWTDRPAFDRMTDVRLGEARWRRPVSCPRCGGRPTVSRFNDRDYVRAEVKCDCGLAVRSDLVSMRRCERERHLLLRRTVADWNALCSGGRVPGSGWYEGWPYPVLVLNGDGI